MKALHDPHKLGYLLLLLVFTFLYLAFSQKTKVEEKPGPATWADMLDDGAPTAGYTPREESAPPGAKAASYADAPAKAAPAFHSASMIGNPWALIKGRTRHTPPPTEASAHFYIQRPAPDNRELAKEQAVDWAYTLNRRVSIGVDHHSTSTANKMLIGPYHSREEAERDRMTLQIEGLVLDIRRKNWKVLSINYN